MRGAGGTRGADGGGGGGGSVVLGGDLAGTSSAASVVRVGDSDVVSNWVEFSALGSVVEVAGVWTFDSTIIVAGDIVVPTGDRLVSGENGALVSLTRGHKIIGDVDNYLISGPVVMLNVAVVNSSVGASAWAMLVESLAGRNINISGVDIFAIRGMRIQNVFAGLDINNSGAADSSNAIGFSIGGFIGAVGIRASGTLVGSASQVGIEIDATTTFGSGISLADLSFVFTAPGQFGLAIADAMTAPAGSYIFISSSFNAGDQASFMRQNPGDMSRFDNRLLVNGNPSEPNWGAAVAASRLDIANPVEVTFPGPTPVPYKDGVNLPEIVLDSSPARFSLFKDPLDPTNWYVQYDGIRPNVEADISWSILVDRSSGTGELTGFIERNDAAPGYLGWTVISSSVAAMDNTNERKSNGRGTTVIINPGDRFRVSLDNLADLVNARVYQVTLNGVVGS